MYYKGLKNRLVNYLSASFSAFCHYVSAANCETQEQMRARIKANMQQDTASKIWAGVITRAY